MVIIIINIIIYLYFEVSIVRDERKYVVIQGFMIIFLVLIF